MNTRNLAQFFHVQRSRLASHFKIPLVIIRTNDIVRCLEQEKSSFVLYFEDYQFHSHASWPCKNITLRPEITDDGPLIVVFGSSPPPLTNRKSTHKTVKVRPPLTKLSGFANELCLETLLISTYMYIVIKCILREMRHSFMFCKAKSSLAPTAFFDARRISTWTQIV